jgi:pimeloyl-ACP methyl ester carboxylesterase
MAAWAADAGGLADHLEFGRFAVVGWSGGGQFALAVAAGLQDQDRVSAVALLGTPAPANGQELPWVPEQMRQLVSLVHTDHSAYDWPAVVADAPLVFDTRNATAGIRDPKIRRL